MEKEIKSAIKHLRPRLPTSEPAKRIATLFRRQLTTSWSKKEVQRFRLLVNDGLFENLDDLGTIERYYAFERKKPFNKGFHRRDLDTFINNYRCEVDRAKEWELTHPLVRVRKIIPMPPSQSDAPPVVVDDETRNKFLSDFEKMRGRKLKQP